VLSGYLIGALVALIAIGVVNACLLVAVLHRLRRPERPARRRAPVVHHAPAVTAIQPVSDERYTPGVVRITPGYAEGRRVR
jgi:hypothetical protein